MIAFVALIASALFPACSLFSSGLDDKQQERLDADVKEAASQYDEGHYDKAYKYATLAREIDPKDLRARVIQAYSLMQLGQNDPFFENISMRHVPGARQLFEDVLKDSPNEFKARQGLAIMAFSEHLVFHDKKMRDFLGMELELRAFSEKVSSLKTLSPNDPGFFGKLSDLRAEYDNFRVRYIRCYETRQYFEDAPPISKNPDPKLKLLTGRTWAEDSTYVDAIRFDLDQRRFDDAAATLATLREGAKTCAFYWEQRSLERLEYALKLYTQLESGAPWHAGTKRDLAFVHVAFGQFWLNKALEDAKRDAATKLANIPAEREAEVIRSFYCDEGRHDSELRPHVKREFADAIANLREFVRLDEEREKQRVEHVEEQEKIAAGDESNIFMNNLVGRFGEEMQFAIKEARSYRKMTILLLIELYTFPIYGVQDFEQATLWVNRLRDIDDRDPIFYFIWASIREQSGDAAGAIEDYDNYLARSSIVEDANRRTVARSRMDRLKLEAPQKN